MRTKIAYKPSAQLVPFFEDLSGRNGLQVMKEEVSQIIVIVFYLRLIALERLL